MKKNWLFKIDSSLGPYKYHIVRRIPIVFWVLWHCEVVKLPVGPRAKTFARLAWSLNNVASSGLRITSNHTINLFHNP
jgi:hypothetical protein